MPRIPTRSLALLALSCTTLAAGVAPALARGRHHAAMHHVSMHHATMHHAEARRGAPASHAAIPQNRNIENLNDLSLRRARAGQDTSRPLAPALAQ